MSTLFVDTINEKTTNNGVEIPGHVINVQFVSLVALKLQPVVRLQMLQI